MTTILENKKKDWLYIILSPIAGFLLIGFYLLVKQLFEGNDEIALLSTFLVYAICFDVRHLFSTYTRTLLDKDYFSENRKWLIWTFLFIIGLPILALVFVRDETYYFGTGAVFLFIFRVTTVLGLYHLIKQNWGFMAIYKKKANEMQTTTEKWEKLMLLSGSFLPLVILTINSPTWFEFDKMYLFPESYLEERVHQLFFKLGVGTCLLGILLLGFSYLTKSFDRFRNIFRNLGWYFVAVFVVVLGFLKFGVETLNYLLVIVGAIFVISTCITLANSWKTIQNNPKKWLVLLASLLLYNGVLLSPIENKFILIMAITIPHNIQYLAFVNFFNRKYYSSNNLNFGVVKSISQKLSLFVLVSFGYALLYELFRTGSKFVNWGDPTINYIIGNYIAVFFLSMSLHHYFLDAIIWRVRSDKKISESV